MFLSRMNIWLLKAVRRIQNALNCIKASLLLLTMYLFFFSKNKKPHYFKERVLRMPRCTLGMPLLSAFLRHSVYRSAASFLPIVFFPICFPTKWCVHTANSLLFLNWIQIHVYYIFDYFTSSEPSIYSKIKSFNISVQNPLVSVRARTHTCTHTRRRWYKACHNTPPVIIGFWPHYTKMNWGAWCGCHVFTMLQTNLHSLTAIGLHSLIIHLQQYTTIYSEKTRLTQKAHLSSSHTIDMPPQSQSTVQCNWS